ncbi:MAG: bacillithiol biosynthesis cysteine-adding enzyme BshC [Niabella sp.]
MKFEANNISYAETGYYSDIVLDYLEGAEALKPFYKYVPVDEELHKVIESRCRYNTDRILLFEALTGQYEQVEPHQAVKNNIELLKAPTTFTITTAHQPNIFTGPLYFIYKILHAIKLSEHCKQKFSQYDFVPVYYMGSEDADIDELGHVFLDNEKLEWATKQTGAVGRMVVDEALLQLISRMTGEVNILPYGEEITGALRQFYRKGTTIQNATLDFVNHIFGKYGLIVLIPDHSRLKAAAADIFREELFHQRSSAIVAETAEHLVANGYKPQARGRDINLFYLDDHIRSRIERAGDCWKVADTEIIFTKEQLLGELEVHPERFSPNVILRGLFQEMILPNIIFIGGGGELAYWLELKNIFDHYAVPYPMLVLRNSFLLINRQQTQRIKKLGYTVKDIFLPLKTLQDKWIGSHSGNNITVDQTLKEMTRIYETLTTQARNIDGTLTDHVASLKKQAGKKIAELGKKFLRAEKRNHQTAMQQIEKIKRQLFPFHNLQERIDNIVPFYARWGGQLLEHLYSHSYALEQYFVVFSEVP